MTEQDLIQIKQTFPNLKTEEGEDWINLFLEISDAIYLRLTISIEKHRNGGYTSRLFYTTDSFSYIYSSSDLNEVLEKTKCKLTKLFLDMYNQVK